MKKKPLYLFYPMLDTFQRILNNNCWIIYGEIKISMGYKKDQEDIDEKNLHKIYLTYHKELINKYGLLLNHRTGDILSITDEEKAKKFAEKYKLVDDEK